MLMGDMMIGLVVGDMRGCKCEGVLWGAPAASL